MAGLGGPPGLMTSGLLLGSGGGSGSGGGGSGSGSGAVVGMLIPTAAVGSAGAPSGCTSPLAALRTNDGLSSPTAAGGSRTPGSNHAKGPRQLVYLGRLYGSEVVGRKCCVQLRGGARTFDKAVIVDFNDASGQHRVRHAATKAEEWVSLGDIKFYWREAAPPEAPPNPSFKPECSSEACVGRRLRVYWPAMQKWYCGSVKAYDPLTGQHTVFYKDGDQQRLVLKHEPIVWADDEAAAEASGLITFISAANTTSEAAGGATTPRHPSSGTALGALGSSSGGGGGGAGLFGGAPAGLLVPQGLFGGGSAMGLAPAGVGAGAGAAGVVGSLQPQPQPPPQLPPQQPQQQQQAAEPSTTYRAIVRRCFPPTPTRGNKGRAGGKPPSGRGGASVLGKHAREGAASADGVAAAPPKRKRGPKALRPAAMTAAAAAVVPNKHLAVNCRIGVYWRLDKAFYTGKIKGYFPQTGRFTLQYDDGQCEAVLLERERFVWHSPRGVTAGFKPALHALMHALGAEGVKAVPLAQQQQQEAGAPEGSRLPAPLTPAPEGAPHPPSSGPGAVGWRLALYWPADGAWHEAEVLSFNEPKRLHHVLYLDGEEEWLELGSETVVFLRAARSTAITAGHFLTTDDVSKKGGHDAVGWHLAVYWKDDKQFYQGQVADYNPASGKHKVVYVDGEVEELHLANERVIWRLPPNEASESGDDADGDAAAAATAKRNRGRGRDSDESDDMMETEEPVTEEPATATDDDASTGGGGGGATGKKRPGGKAGATTIIKRRRRTRRGRGRPRTWHYDSDHSSDGRLLLHRHQQQPWGAHLVGSSAAQHGDAAAGGGSTAGQAHQFATPRAPGMAGTDAARVLMPRQSSTGGGGPSTAGTPAAAVGAGSMRPPAAAGGGPGTAGSGLLRMSSSGLPPAAQSGRAGGSVLGSSVAPNGVLQLTLPAIQIRRATGGSGDGGACGSPLLLLPGGQRLESMQLNVRIVAGGAAADVDAAGAAAGPQQQRAVGSSSGSSGGAVAAAPADGGPTTAPAAGTAPAGGQAGSARATAAAATAAALAPLLPQMPAQHQRTALRLQRKMDRLDMIMGKLTATASTYGWRLDPLDPLPPLQQARTPGRGGAGGRGGPGRSRSQPTSPTGVAGGGGSAGGRLGLSSPRAGSGPLSPRAAAYNGARAAAAAAGGSAGGVLNGSNAGSLPTSPRGSMGAMSPTAAGAVAASGAGLAAGRPVAVHKTCAVKSRPGSSSGSGAQRLKARPYGGPAGGTGVAGAHSSSSTGGPGGAIAASTGGGSGELTSVLQAAAAGNAIANQLQQHIQQQQQQLLQAGFITAATGDAAAATALTAQAQLALAAAAAAKAEAAAPAGSAAAAAATTAMGTLLTSQANPAVPSSARASDEVVLRLQALAQGSGGLQLQQQLQYLQSAALATAAANAATAATAGTPAAGGGSKAADKATAEAAGKNK